ncbi:MAG: DnaB-like helicase C-terminal domain-containing protein, partial [Pseudomonadota bacterium]
PHCAPGARAASARQLPIAQVAARARRLKRAPQGLHLLIVDYLQLLRANSNKDSRVNEISEITQGLKAIAKELNIPVIALSQLSRQVEQRDDKRPQLSDLRESGSIEQDADLIMMLYREEYYDPDTPDRGIAEVILTKHRNGPTGTVKLLFQPEYTQFLNRASDLSNRE